MKFNKEQEINAVPFMQQLAERISKKINRDLSEIEQLQHNPESAIKFAKSSVKNIATLITSECISFNEEHGVFIKEINSIKGVKRVEKPEYNWYVNPMSNLYNYSHANSNFAVSAALVSDKKHIICSMIYLPYYETLFYATNKGGCYRIDHLGNTMKVRVAGRKPGDIISVSSSIPIIGKVAQAFDPRTIKADITGCMLIDSIRVASGQTDIVISENDWKVNSYAAELIINQAKGIATVEVLAENIDKVNFVAGNHELVTKLDYFGGNEELMESEKLVKDEELVENKK